MEQRQELLTVEHLTKSYDGKGKALHDVSLSLGRGEFVTVIGPSGAGKSTFLRCINRLIDASEGSIEFDGREITSMNKRQMRKVRRDIGMIFQHYNLVHRATAIENVLQGRLGYLSDFRGIFGLYSEEDKRSAFELLDKMGLAEFAYQRADQLSGGQQQRVGIVGLVAGFLAINALSGAYVDFDFMEAAADIPGGLAWMAVNFLPSAASLEKLPQIMPALLSTVLDSIAASTTAALLAYVVAVLGSRSVGLGGVAQVLARGIASLFRNIPVVAWAFILLFSFHQSEFTGFLALFLGSFGYLTRCFLESIDEISSGTIEALRATGASYLQVVAQGVIPLSVTSVVSWMLYMVETNIRDATLVGILTGTGIGFVFNLFYKSFRYDVAGLVILLIVVVVICCESVSNYVRRRIL